MCTNISSEAKHKFTTLMNLYISQKVLTKSDCSFLQLLLVMNLVFWKWIFQSKWIVQTQTNVVMFQIILDCASELFVLDSRVHICLFLTIECASICP